MADLNKVFLMGRLTFDPELRRTPERDGGDRAAAGDHADAGRAATASGREETLFIDVTVWDRQAENCCQFLRKGSAVHVEGYSEDGHLGRQDHGREAVEDPGAGRSRAVPRLAAIGSGGGAAAWAACVWTMRWPPPARDAGMRRGSGRARREGRPAVTASRAGRSMARPRPPYPPAGPSGPSHTGRRTRGRRYPVLIAVARTRSVPAQAGPVDPADHRSTGRERTHPSVRNRPLASDVKSSGTSGTTQSIAPPVRMRLRLRVTR